MLPFILFSLSLVLISKSKDKEFSCIVFSECSFGESSSWLDCFLLFYYVHFRTHLQCCFFCLLSHQKSDSLPLELFSQVSAFSWAIFDSNCPQMTFVFWLCYMSPKVVSNAAFHHVKLSSFQAICCLWGPSWAGSKSLPAWVNPFGETAFATPIETRWVSYLRVFTLTQLQRGERTGCVSSIQPC